MTPNDPIPAKEIQVDLDSRGVYPREAFNHLEAARLRAIETLKEFHAAFVKVRDSISDTPSPSEADRSAVIEARCKCGKTAACLGQYEGSVDPEYACNDCCAHGNEDGQCFMLPLQSPPSGVQNTLPCDRCGKETSDAEAYSDRVCPDCAKPTSRQPARGEMSKALTMLDEHLEDWIEDKASRHSYQQMKAAIKAALLSPRGDGWEEAIEAAADLLIFKYKWPPTNEVIKEIRSLSRPAAKEKSVSYGVTAQGKVVGWGVKLSEPDASLWGTFNQKKNAEEFCRDRRAAGYITAEVVALVAKENA